MKNLLYSSLIALALALALVFCSCEEQKPKSNEELQKNFRISTALRIDFSEPVKLSIKMTKPSAHGGGDMIRGFEVDGSKFEKVIGLHNSGVFDLKIGELGSFPIVMSELDSVLEIKVETNPFSYQVIKGQNSAYFESYLNRFAPDQSFGLKSKVDFLDSISPSPAGAHLYGYELTTSPDFYVSSFGSILSKYQSKEYGKEVVAKIQELTFGNLGFGKPIPDFKLPKFQTNKQTGPSDFKGNYLLIDFWASWCGPCRRENPNVKAAYQEWRSKGFEVLGVSTDRSAANWGLAIQQDEMTWHQVLDVQGEVSQQYNIQAIPTVFLVDPKGNIIAKNVRGAKLEQLLEFYLAE